MVTDALLKKARALLWLLAAAALATPGIARADDVTIGSTSLLRAYQAPRYGQLRSLAPAYFILNAAGRDIRNPLLKDLKVVLSTWGRLDPGERMDERFARGDVTLAFVEGNLLSKRIDVRVGRQLLLNGPSRITQLDGAHATFMPFKWGFGVSGYFGMPVRSAFQVVAGDAIAGTRVFWRHSFETEVGGSFIHVMNAGRIARQDFAFDARHVLHRTVTLSAYLALPMPRAFYGLSELRPGGPLDDVPGALRDIGARIRTGRALPPWPLLAEADLALTWAPIEQVQFVANYRRTSPELFLDRSSILWVFADQRYDEVGSSMYFLPVSFLRMEGAYHLVRTDAGIPDQADAGNNILLGSQSGFGHRGMVNAQLSFGPRRRTLVGTMGRVLSFSRNNGYINTRLYARHQLLQSLSATVDADAYMLHQPVNGQRMAFTLAGTAMWQFLPGWNAGLTASAGVTPFVEQRFEVIARLSHRVDIRLRDFLP